LLAIFAAMDSEIHPLLAGATLRETHEVRGFRVSYVDYGGVEAVICRTGIGRCAQEAAAAVLDACRASAAISFGIAGAISPVLRAGNVVICDLVCVSVDSGYCNEDGSLAAHDGLLGAVRAAGLSVLTGTSLTVDRAVMTAAEKQRLRESYGHDVVEMESYWVAKEAAQRGVPFLTVRIVTDEAEDSVPDAPFVGPDGAVDYDRLAAWAREHPDEVAVLSALNERWRLGAEGMATFAATFLQPSRLASFMAAV
jgi:adenosylhomocysteine nucleosidase